MHGTTHYSDTPPQRSAKETPESAQAGQAVVDGPVLQVTLGGLSSPPMDPVFEKAMARYFAEMMSSCERKVMDPDSCVFGELKP